MTQAQVEIGTGTILAIGLFPAGSPDPATITIVDLTADQETALAESGAKVLNGDGSITVTPPPPPPEPETPVASILMLMLADVTDIDETKPILEAILALLGGTLVEE